MHKNDILAVRVMFVNDFNQYCHDKLLKISTASKTHVFEKSKKKSRQWINKTDDDNNVPLLNDCRMDLWV